MKTTLNKTNTSLSKPCVILTMPTYIKRSPKETDYRNTIIKAFHIDIEEFETNLLQKLPYESYINFCIDSHYYNNTPINEAIILIFKYRNYCFKNIKEEQR